jgi:hypothetical protein
MVLSLQRMPVIAHDLRIASLAFATLLAACSSGGAPTDAGGNSDGGGTSCGDATCATDQVCVRTLTMGGPLLCPQDGGSCPGNEVLSTNGCCVAVPDYSCAARPSGCGATVTCACASTLCAPSHVCSEPGGNVLACSLLAP